MVLCSCGLVILNITPVSLVAKQKTCNLQTLKSRLEPKTSAKIHGFCFVLLLVFVFVFWPRAAFKKYMLCMLFCFCFIFFKWRDINLPLEPGEESDYFSSGAISSVIVIHSVNSIWPLQKHFCTSM